MHEKLLTEAFETLPDIQPTIPEDINLRVLAHRAWEIYNYHKITSYGSIARILHVDIEIVERLLSIGHHLNKQDGQYGD